MEYKDIKQLIDDMGESKIDTLEIEFPDGTKINMKKKENHLKTHDAHLSVCNTPLQTSSTLENVSCIEETITEGNTVKSPMVGTFYASLSPDKEPFVKIGSKVKKGDTLCIIEAMKLMNEIESEFDGEVVEILIKNEEMVEYNKPLFIIV